MPRNQSIGLIRKPVVEGKVRDIIRSFKKQGYKLITARDISVCCNMDARRTSSYLKMMPELVEYDRKKSEWRIR